MKVLELIEIRVLPPGDGEIVMQMTRGDGAVAQVPMSMADAKKLIAAVDGGHKLRIVGMSEATSTVTISVEGEVQ